MELAQAQAEELAYAEGESSQVGSHRALRQIANSSTHPTVQKSSHAIWSENWRLA